VRDPPQSRRGEQEEAFKEFTVNVRNRKSTQREPEGSSAETAEDEGGEIGQVPAGGGSLNTKGEKKRKRYRISGTDPYLSPETGNLGGVGEDLLYISTLNVRALDRLGKL